LHALAPIRVAVFRLANTSNKTVQQEGPRICCASEEELEFLLWREGKRVLVQGGVEGGHYAHHPLVLLLLQLLRGSQRLTFLLLGLLSTSLGTGTASDGRRWSLVGRGPISARAKSCGRLRRLRNLSGRQVLIDASCLPTGQ
jgi:hypothetical protein